MENPFYIHPFNILYALCYKIPRGLLKLRFALSSKSKSENYEVISASNP